MWIVIEYVDGSQRWIQGDELEDIWIPVPQPSAAPVPAVEPAPASVDIPQPDPAETAWRRAVKRMR